MQPETIRAGQPSSPLEIQPVLESEWGELLSSGDGDSEGSDEDGSSNAPLPKRPKLDSNVAVFLEAATGKPLEHEKRKKLVGHFPLPALNAAHPLKLDKDLAVLIPRSASNYDRLLSKIQQFGMDVLGPLLTVLTHAKKGKCTIKELLAPPRSSY